MFKDFSSLAGLVYTEPGSGAAYGPIRPVDAASLESDGSTTWLVFAEDECGNAFLAAADGRVAFWDHETDELVVLAPSSQAFINGCAEPPPVEFDPKGVKSVWIDPALARELGICPGSAETGFSARRRM